MAVVHFFRRSAIFLRFLKPLNFFFLIFLSFLYIFFVLNLTFYFFSVIFKFFFLILFFFFNILNFFLFLNIYDFLFIFLGFIDLSHLSFFFYSNIKVLLIFILDSFIFFKLILFTSLDLRNFVGIFFSLTQFLNELIYETVFQFIEQTEEHVMVSELNWMPRYIFGDMLERSFRINKVLNLFKFSDLFYEKTFVYKRVGVLNSRFWIFRHFNFLKKTEHRFRKEIGSFIEPDRWLLDFRDFKLSDYLDPSSLFSNRSIFRDSRTSFISPTYRKRGNYVSVQLLHNYYSVMETKHIIPSERSYSDYYVSSFFFYELVLVFFVYTYLLVTVEPHLQFNLFDIDAEDLELIDKGDVNVKMHPYIEYWNISDNVESKYFSAYPLDVYEYTKDDDLSWDFLLAQPQNLQYHSPSDIEEFETYKDFNSLFDEFRTFSFLYPIYRMVIKLTSYRLFDFYVFTDSGQCFRIIFFGLLYLPIALFILLMKYFLRFYDFFRGFSFLLKLAVLFSFFSSIILFL